MPDANSNSLTTHGLASVTCLVNDLGFSGDGGPQVSENLTINLIFDAVNDAPVVNTPDSLEAMEDVPLLVPGLGVLDIDSDEPGGETHLKCPREWLLRHTRFCSTFVEH